MMPRIALAAPALAALVPTEAKADPWCGPGYVLRYDECVPYRHHHHHHYYEAPRYYAPSMGHAPSHGYGRSYDAPRRRGYGY